MADLGGGKSKGRCWRSPRGKSKSKGQGNGKEVAWDELEGDGGWSGESDLSAVDG
jgi:hypothetical protein